MVMAEHMSATADFSGCPGRYVTVVIFCSGLYRSTSLSDVHLTTLVGYAANPRSPQSQEIAEWRRLDICLDGRLTHFMFLVNILLRWLHVVWYNGKRETEVGLSLGFEVLTAGLRAVLSAWGTIFPESGLRKSNSSWGFPSYTETWLCAPVLK